MSSDRAILYEYVAFLIFILSTKKRYSSFLKKVFVSQEICFKVKALNTFKISSDCHIKTCWTLKRRAIFKITSTIFEKNLYAFPVGSKMKPLKKHFLVLRQKQTQILLKGATFHFLSVWWISFLKHLFLYLWQWNVYNLTDYVNIWKRSEAEKLLFH